MNETESIVAVVRRPRPNEIEAIHLIELHHSPHPWQINHLEDELSNPLSHFYVIEDCTDHQIFGYIVFWVIDNIIELHNITIADSHRRSGQAVKLMQQMFEVACDQNIDEGFLEVRRSNIAAIHLYQKMGFQQISERKRYYRNPVEDALIYRVEF